MNANGTNVWNARRQVAPRVAFWLGDLIDSLRARYAGASVRQSQGRCYVCGEAVSGRYRVDHWGPVCASHGGAHEPVCYSCTKLVAAEGGVRLGDGRAFCNTCRSTAVTSRAELMSCYRTAHQFMRQVGFRQLPDVRVEFLGSERKTSRRDSLGVTHGLGRQDHTGRSHGLRFADIGVGVRDSLPARLCEAVLVHELYHVYENLLAIESTPSTSEGCACLCSWLYLGTMAGSPGVSVFRALIETRRDRVYGGGFRRAHHALVKRGFPWLMSRVIEGKSIRVAK